MKFSWVYIRRDNPYRSDLLVYALLSRYAVAWANSGGEWGERGARWKYMSEIAT